MHMGGSPEILRISGDINPYHSGFRPGADIRPWAVGLTLYFKEFFPHVPHARITQDLVFK